MNLDEYMVLLSKIAKENNLELTDNAEKIARFRVRTQMPMEKCPCSPMDSSRGCIGPKCWEELNTDGICHCSCFRKVN